MGRASQLTANEVSQILKLVARNGWTARANGASSFQLYPPNGGPPMPLRHSRSGKFLTYAQLRARGVEADPRRMTGAAGGAQQKIARDSDEAWIVPTLPKHWRKTVPLPDGYEPSDQAKCFGFTTHALDRMKERNFHLWEVYAAIDHQDFAYSIRRPGYPDLRRHCYVRGDVVVVDDPDTTTVITVMNANAKNGARIDRVMQTPAMPPEESMSTATVKPWLNQDLPTSHAIRLFLASFDNGDDVNAATVIEELCPDNPKRGYHVLGQLVDLHLIARTDTGWYRIVDRDALAILPTHGIHAASEVEVRSTADAANRQGMQGSARVRVLTVLRSMQVGDIFTVGGMRNEIGEDVTVSNLHATLHSMANKGIVREAGYTDLGGKQFELTKQLVSLEEFVAGHDWFTLEQLMADTGYSKIGLVALLETEYSTQLVRDEETGEYHKPGASRPAIVDKPIPAVEPEKLVPAVEKQEPPVYEEPPVIPAQREERATVDAVAPLLEFDDAEEDAVSYTFEFTPLPESFITTVAGMVLRNINQLHAHAGRWVRVAVYDQTILDNAEDVARKNMTRVEAHLGDDALQFTTRWIDETQIGVFVRVRPTRGNG